MGVEMHYEEDNVTDEIIMDNKEKETEKEDEPKQQKKEEDVTKGWRSKFLLP